MWVAVGDNPRNTGRDKLNPNGVAAIPPRVRFDLCGVVRSWDVLPWVCTHGYSYPSPLGTHGSGSWARSLRRVGTARLQIAGAARGHERTGNARKP
jgi:hypothetical protein